MDLQRARHAEAMRQVGKAVDGDGEMTELTL